MTTLQRRPSKNLSRWGKVKDQAKAAATNSEQTAASQRTIDRVTKERDELKKKLDSSLKENASQKNSMYVIAKKVMDVTFPTPFYTGLEKDPSNVSEEELVEMIGRLIPVEKNVSLESRIEEVETRITLLNGELGKLFKLKLNVENSLNELISSQDLEAMKRTARKLRHDSCSTKLFVNDSLKLERLESEDNSRDTSSPTPELRKYNTGVPSQVQVNLQQVNIPPPSGTRKAPDTHIKNMQVELRQIVIQDLSLYKGGGADWRLFAQRVGVPDALVDQWQQGKVPQPMRNVLGLWAASPGATVRMLHRHLVSPQMRCVLLAKRISDYYEVD